MTNPERRNVGLRTRAEGGAVGSLDTDDTIRLCPRDDVQLERTGAFFLPERPAGRAVRFELGTALRLLTPSAPLADARTSSKRSPETRAEPRAIDLAGERPEKEAAPSSPARARQAFSGSGRLG